MTAAAAQQAPRPSLQNAPYKFAAEPEAMNIQSEALTSRHPRLLLRIATLYMLGVYKNQNNKSQLGVSMSHDGGDSFEMTAMVSDPNASVSSHGQNNPSLAISGGAVYALWEQSREGGGTDLMFARSLRMGHVFEKPIPIITDKTTPSTNGFSNLGVAPNGDVYAVWLDGRDPKETPGTFSIYFSRSTDRGATFSKNMPIAASVCPCCRPNLTFGAKGEVYVGWRKVFDNDIRDMVIAASLDNGATFKPAVRAAVDNWKLSGCPDTGPAMQVKGNRLYVAWYSEGNGNNAGIRIVQSDDSGKTFSKPIIASGNTQDANHPAFSLSADGRLLMVFQGRDATEKDGWGTVRPYIVEVLDDGSVTQPLAVPGNKKSIAYPTIAAGTVGRVFVAWTEGTAKGSAIFLSRGRREAPEQTSSSGKVKTSGQR